MCLSFDCIIICLDAEERQLTGCRAAQRTVLIGSGSQPSSRFCESEIKSFRTSRTVFGSGVPRILLQA
ncbi:MAG: hypothetical protein CMJ62_17470 [Planctomycetaceae bacterium]|nr:hypothetical protein [Planctomycetaceae bacterium]